VGQSAEHRGGSRRRREVARFPEPGTIGAFSSRMNRYTLPKLPYDYDALQPVISAEILELHHDKHHATYVKQANEALEQLEGLAEKRDFERLSALEKALAFNLSGHVLHSLFWQNLSPTGGDRPEGSLVTFLERDFGGFDRFREQLNATAAGIMGSGWAALVWEPLGKRLVTTQIYDHQSNLSQCGIPLLVIDAWEHAYYLQYKNEKKKFFDAIWELFDWEDVQARFDTAQQVEVGIANATAAQLSH
jgi:superoxide dismutase, Fe-Mn family